VPRCGALSLLQKPLHYRGIHLNSCPALCIWALAQFLPAHAFQFLRYLILVFRPLLAAALVVRRRYLIEVPRSMPAAPRRYLIVVPRPLPAAPLVVPCRCLAIVPRPMPAAARRNLILVPRPLPAAALVVYHRAVFIYRGAQAVARGGARCAPNVLHRCARPLPATPRR
jgi:hypothetical protein